MLFEKHINILALEMASPLALEMASPGNQHCAYCIGALSFLMLTSFSDTRCIICQLTLSGKFSISFDIHSASGNVLRKRVH